MPNDIPMDLKFQSFYLLSQTTKVFLLLFEQGTALSHDQITTDFTVVAVFPGSIHIAFQSDVNLYSHEKRRSIYNV